MSKLKRPSAPSRPSSKQTLKPSPEARATVGGPAAPSISTDSRDDLAAKVAGTEELAAAFPYNANKPLETDPEPR